MLRSGLPGLIEPRVRGGAGGAAGGVDRLDRISALAREIISLELKLAAEEQQEKMSRQRRSAPGRRELDLSGLSAADLEMISGAGEQLGLQPIRSPEHLTGSETRWPLSFCPDG